MLKKFLSVIFGATILAGATCSATVPSNQLSVGGVQFGAEISAVEKAFGQPAKVKRKLKSYGEKLEYKYGDGLEIEFVGGKVSEVEIKHFSEIGIGSTAAQVEAAYGKPDFVHKDKLIYRSNNQNLALKFEIKNGFVKEIKFGVDD